ncbi:MAG: hypothetical protein EBQ87_15920 [Planctomycetes bacterium]|nr:hypothetical protein [Planctomycetota bacterium]
MSSGLRLWNQAALSATLVPSRKSRGSGRFATAGSFAVSGSEAGSAASANGGASHGGQEGSTVQHD